MLLSCGPPPQKKTHHWYWSLILSGFRLLYEWKGSIAATTQHLFDWFLYWAFPNWLNSQLTVLCQQLHSWISQRVGWNSRRKKQKISWWLIRCSLFFNFSFLSLSCAHRHTCAYCSHSLSLFYHTHFPNHSFPLNIFLYTLSPLFLIGIWIRNDQHWKKCFSHWKQQKDRLVKFFRENCQHTKQAFISKDKILLIFFSLHLVLTLASVLGFSCLFTSTSPTCYFWIPSPPFLIPHSLSTPFWTLPFSHPIFELCCHQSLILYFLIFTPVPPPLSKNSLYNVYYK